MHSLKLYQPQQKVLRGAMRRMRFSLNQRLVGSEILPFTRSFIHKTHYRRRRAP